MTKDEILYTIKLTGVVYQDHNEIDWDKLGLKKLSWFNDKQTDTQGFLARKGDVMYVVWRGSSSQKDFIKDAQVKRVAFRKSGEKVHKGFFTAFKSIKDRLSEELKNVNHEEISSIVICGHSLGAALTTISSYVICDDFPKLAPLVKTLTIGSPRVGNSTFVTNYNKLVPSSLRLVNDRDIVARIPKIGYTHINDGIIVNDNGKRVFYSSLNPITHVTEILISDLDGEAVKDHSFECYMKVFQLWDAKT